MSRESFLARVRAAAAAGRGYHVRVRTDLTSVMGYCGAGDDLPARMASEVRAAGGESHLVADLAEAARQVTALLDDYRPRSALCWQHPLLDRLGLNALLAARDVERIDHASLAPLPAHEQREKMLAADIGLSSCTLAVAETGSLVMASQPGRERAASLLPPVHVAVIEAAQILPDLFDLFERLETQGLENLASNITLITGPSKTGDLELKLTTGVHGPGRWHVVIIRSG
jgi:L-lactate dehydrogenase complex protein LldG